MLPLNRRTITNNRGWKLRNRRPVHFCFAAALVIGALHAWAERHSMNSDGVSYLDLAEAYRNADWSSAINAYWSPLYSWLLAAAMYLLAPSPYWEFPVVHLVNFVIYLLSLISFTFFLSEFIRYHRLSTDELPGYVSLAEWAWIFIGYSLFVWSSIEFTNPSLVTPDALVGAVVFLLAALLVRSKRIGEAKQFGLFLVFGLLLGLGYLAKAAMLPMAVVFIGLAVLPTSNVRREVLRLATILIGFILVACPFIIALSASKGRLTFGDTAKLNYAWFVSGVKYRHWRGESPAEGAPQNLTRIIYENPTVYEFASSKGKTFGPWDDPSYWYEGLKIRFNLQKQVHGFRNTVRSSADIISDQKSVIIVFAVGSAILFWMSFQSGYKFSRKFLLHLTIPGLAAAAMYSLVHLESRFIAPFVVLFWLGVLARVMLRKSLDSTNLLTCVSIILLFALTMKITASSVPPAYVTVRELLKSDYDSRAEMWHVADGLQRLGLMPGDTVAIVGWGSDESYWARLARVKIIAELSISHGWGFTEGDKFWNSSETVKSDIYAALAQRGVTAIVGSVPSFVSAQGWQKIGNTQHSVYLIKPNLLPHRIDLRQTLSGS